MDLSVHFYASGHNVGPREEEDEEEGRSIHDADKSHRCHPEAPASCWTQHLCPRRTRTNRSGKEPLHAGIKTGYQTMKTALSPGSEHGDLTYVG